MSTEEKPLENQAYGNLMGLLNEYAPEIVAELKEKISEITRSAYSQGFDAGLKETIKHDALDERNVFLRGEAKGMVWAYHTVRLNGKAVQVPENPYVHENIVNGLMNPGRLMR